MRASSGSGISSRSGGGAAVDFGVLRGIRPLLGRDPGHRQTSIVASYLRAAPARVRPRPGDLALQLLLHCLREPREVLALQREGAGTADHLAV